MVVSFILIATFSISFIGSVLAAPEIVIVSHTSYIDSFWDSHTIIGEIQNIGDQPATNVDITATYYNADNEVISDLGGPIVELNVLLPGRKSPFGSSDLSTDPQLIDHYSLNVSFTPCDPIPEKLEIISHNSTIDPYDEYLHIIGEVQNSGDLQDPSVHVVATCYNEAGTVVAFSADYVRTVNQKADFDIIIESELPDPITSYTLTAATDDYAAIAEIYETHVIPEFSSFILIILTVTMVSIASLLYKRKIIKN